MEKKQNEYLVLARKYRPQVFSELVGQEALVKTLANAIKSGRIHHAYILNGVRGIGKTTTARILAKALNCENGPAIEWDKNDPQCQAITDGRHVDVMEFDAASHTGIDNIRELFEGVAYQPAQGRYKIYIIDEVHMLSKQAFNALLKTLEEPPANVKFIFATTEVNKLPVTVLSRCQRFDLKRISSTVLVEHFNNLLIKEGVKAEEGAVRMIARSADGSVRDGLSLLDQAIALAGGEQVTEKLVSDMLGLADRGKIYDLFENLMSGNAQNALTSFSAMYDNGYDPILVITDMLQLSHLVTRLKVVPGLNSSINLSELEKTRGSEFAKKLNLENLSRVYQMLLTASEEAKKADRPFEAVEMAIVRVTNMANLPSIASLVEKGVGVNSTSAVEVSPQVKKPKLAVTELPHEDTTELISKNKSETKTSTLSWQEIVKLVREKSISLAAEIEQQAKCVKIEDGILEIEVKSGVRSENEIIASLNKCLNTFAKWQVVKATALVDTETLAQTKKREANERIEIAKTMNDIKQVLEIFPGSEVIAVDIKE